MNDYGYINAETLSLALSIQRVPKTGDRTVMINKMLSLLKTHGYKRVSLSVQKANYAAEMYRKNRL